MLNNTYTLTRYYMSGASLKFHKCSFGVELRGEPEAEEKVEIFNFRNELHTLLTDIVKEDEDLKMYRIFFRIFLTNQLSNSSILRPSRTIYPIPFLTEQRVIHMNINFFSKYCYLPELKTM